MGSLVHVLVEWFKKADAGAQVAAVVGGLGVVGSLVRHGWQGGRWLWGRRAIWLAGRVDWARNFEGLPAGRWKGDTLLVVGFKIVNHSQKEVSVLRVGLARARKKSAEKWELDPRDESSLLLIGHPEAGLLATMVSAGFDKELRYRDDECVKRGAPEDTPLYPFAVLTHGRIVFARRPIVLHSWKRLMEGALPGFPGAVSDAVCARLEARQG